MSEITLRNVCKEYDKGHFAVKDFNLDIQDKEFIIFVGPSGCGKSTTLRMIAGLEDISDGELWIDGDLCNYYEPKDRGLSMVFQNYALYPNMTVYGNLAYALKIRKVPKKEPWRSNIFWTENRLPFPEVRNREWLSEALLSGNQRPSLWMNPCPTWMPN